MVRRITTIRAANTYVQLILETIIEIGLLFLDWRIGDCDCIAVFRWFLWGLTAINAFLITLTFRGVLRGQTIYSARREVALEIAVEIGLIAVDINFIVTECACATVIRWLFVALTFLNLGLIWSTLRGIKQSKKTSER